MSKQFKRIFAILLVLALVLSVMPSAFAAGSRMSGKANMDRPFTEADNEILENDVFAKIEAVKANAATKMGGIGKMTEKDYISIVPQVVKAIESSETYVRGSLQKNGNFLVWETTTGMPCCYDPRMEAKLHNTDNVPTAEQIAAAEAEAEAMRNDVAELNGGSPSSTKIGLIQPYYDSSSNYSDSSFLNYSPSYKSMWQELYTATGGTGMRYTMYNATVDNIAKTIEDCALVIFDSHGTTDYSGYNSDYTSRANCSYLCLITNSGVTSADTAAKTGPYGTYYDAITGSGYAYVSGTCIANHMTKNAPHSLVYMGICLGMATDGMYKGLRNRGVETVWGYSQSVTFSGEKIYMQNILGYVKNGDSFKDAVYKTKQAKGWWDPAYSNYSESQARNAKAAFPICVSSEDTYPGHGNVDAVQNVYSTWTLFGGNSNPTYTVTAVSNNTSYGTVSVNGNVITATPKTGYYASGYTVTSGSATVTQDGNTFTVTPSSNCTVRINFAAKSTVTVTCVANGATYTTLTAYAGESFNLPSYATSVSGYTFVGWATSTVAETTTAPSYFAPGASVSASSNATVYAVYTRTTSTGSSNTYSLVTSAPSNWAGNYVITYGTASSSMYLLKGVTPSSNGASIESASNAVTYANSGASLSNNQLSNVSNAYVFTLAAHGSYYSVQNVSTGTYLGLTSSAYLGAYTTYTSTYCDWTPGVGTNASSMKSAKSGSYPYLSFTTGSKYFWSGSSVNTSVRLWKQAGSSTTYYTTSPTTTTHTHSYGSWTSNNNGTHSRTCSCGDKQTANCTYRDVVTAPTTTSQGYTTHTCTVCGYSYKDSYTNPIDNTTYYTVTFSTPSGVTAPASQTVAANSYVTLPTASAPSGYTFKGWVTSAVSNTTTMPSYLTGSYKVTGNITLRALYSYTSTSGGSGTTYTLVGSTPSSWAGDYIITYGTNTSSLYVLKGLSGNTSYESASCGGAVLLSNTGMTYSNGTLTGATAPYVFKVAADGSYYTIQNSSTGTYLGIYNYYLYSRSSYSSSYCRWTLSCSSNNVTVKNAAGGNYPYLSFYTNSKYFMSSSTVPTGLYFWKQTTTGGTSTTYYTTG